ncbi:RNA polymerase sigma factor [Alkalihalobacillus pseudalcaliphilus]|uniref:RNA polymerase sigma factor n=1 Tax=Alkalihalobacillus pseudalcaliphilus TaxID=79884 RepID=UPI00064E1193|nr:sigma-70 family RNA polymerase sigma factor [Alkalihalobacillus pseudalcaliphilus]KMK77734.1 RNA polymerase [Alkalihalobacillus pseudalcaliphilus]
MEAVYRSLKEDLHRFANSIANHEQHAKDLVQDALEKGLNQTELKDWPIYKQKAWFYRVMKNQLIDEQRKRKKETEWEDELEVPFHVEYVSQLEMVDLMSLLDKHESDIVFRKYWLGHTSKEMAEQLNIPHSTIRYQLAKAIKKLRRYLEEEERWERNLEM